MATLPTASISTPKCSRPPPKAGRGRSRKPGRSSSATRRPDFPETVLFETGYGPSGLPHIGTFGEVARTTMVRHAFRVLTEDKVTTRLLCFSDDMDGMRKMPDNVPDQEHAASPSHKPLTAVPDPFGGEYPSFGAPQQRAGCAPSSTRFGFDYEFASADRLLQVRPLRRDAAASCRSATTRSWRSCCRRSGEERQATYRPFLPISPQDRPRALRADEERRRQGRHHHLRRRGRRARRRLPVTGGHVKLQWKPDFGMRWAALGVDFEMFGKDHQTNASIYDRDLRRSSAAARRSTSSTSCSSTRTARRSRSRRATASPSTSG